MARKMKTMDGNTAASHASYAFTDVAAIYPITPSSNMAEVADKWSVEGRKNIFGETVKIVEMQSEGGAAGTVHGSLTAGALTTTYTASQGLLLMIPNMYKIAGEGLPGVINVSARAVASHALSIFGDHSDVYACRQTGYAMLASSSVQEAMDLTPAAHIAALMGKVPFLNFFDGFRTSHELQKIETWDYDDLAELAPLDLIDAYRKNSLNPNKPVLRGSAQNPDIFFQAREACNTNYNNLPAIFEECLGKINAKAGTDYKLFNYYGAPDAEHIIIAMGSVCQTIEETVDRLNANGGKVGLINVHLYRPFSIKHFISAIPDGVKTISVLDRTKEPGSIGEPLYLDVVAALHDSKFAGAKILSGRYGLGSKDTTPAQIAAVYKNTDKKLFTIGIEDDVTNLSLSPVDIGDTAAEGTTACKFWGLGADGTVGANKNSIKIIGDHTDLYAQAYFSYDSKKSGGVTISHLRFGKEKIKSTYLVSDADFVACHNPAYIGKYDMVSDIKPGGSFLLNCSWNAAELEAHLPASNKQYIAKNNINVYTIDALAIGKELGLGGRVNTVLQSAFFKIAGIIPETDAIKYMKDAATYSYGKKGEAIVKMNHDAIDRGATAIVKIDVPASWATASDSASTDVSAKGDRQDLVDYVNNILVPVNKQEGDKLPVSAFLPYVDGNMPQGAAAYEKRGIAPDVPTWKPENCIQCNFCSYVCPHAVIRPFVLNEDEAAALPEGGKAVPANGLAGCNFTIASSVLDCTGCGSCANVCPGKKGEKALTMEPLETQLAEQKVYDYAVKLPEKAEVTEKFKTSTVKGSQFKQPLLEFSGACAGCGETPYAKLMTQLFGDKMYIANATGCSSIWGGSSPSTPYTVNKAGHGPAWANSLFEDNAEFGYGMYLAQATLRERMAKKVEGLKGAVGIDEAIEAFLTCGGERAETDALVAALEGANATGEVKATIDEILTNKYFLNKKSVWILGGDGWAYDIGFGGLDHVLASGENVNVLVFDTEVYSNTGGQSSKATPTGAIAQFAASGKEIKKKDLAAIAMSYGYVYVAQIAQGADYNQTLKAFIEAESYDGPSLIIAYAPCINHGIKIGMSKAQTEEKLAVEAGYWHTFRFDPRRKDAGENPFVLDSKAPTGDYQAFLAGEVRYNALTRQNPERAAALFAANERQAKEKYESLAKLAE